MDQLPNAAGAAPAGAAAAATPDLAALDQKLDVLSVQVAYLIEQAQETARRQRERSELLHDALPIANDALGLATEQLAEIQEYIDLNDLLRLFKRLLRNGRNLDRAVDQLEGLMDLAATAGPLANDVLEKVTDSLETAEQRGYFALAKGGARAVDRVASSLSPEDLDCMANNAVVLLAAFQGLCQPVESPSVRSLIGQMRDPDVRRGLAVVMRMLRSLGAQAGARQEAPAAGQKAADRQP
jgi:uncharacterized protein YjgD (DUF1641 family)